MGRRRQRRRARRTRRSWGELPLAVRAVGLLAMLVVGITLVELGAREVAPRLPEWHDEAAQTVLMTGHPTRLWGLSPGIKNNVGSTASVSELGLRGEPVEVPRPEGRERVLVLGDSSFFGHGVSDSQTLAVQLQRALAAGGVDVDTVNAAIPGYSVVQSTVLMEEVGWSLEPTLLVMANFWSDNAWAAFHDEDLLRTRELARTNPLVQSAAFRLIVSRVSAALGGRRLVSVAPKEAWPTDAVRRVPLDRYAELSDALVREARSRGVGVVYLAPANTALVAPEEDSYPPAWDPYFDAQEALVAHHGVPWADVTPPFRAVYEQEQDLEGLFLDLMHPTARGQRLMAEAVADTLLEAGWPEQPLLGVEAPFDASVLEDVRPPPGVDVSESPQRQLFEKPVTSTHVDAGAPAVAGRTSTDVVECGGWLLKGEIEAAKGPVRLRVQELGGRVVTSATLTDPGRFELAICADVGQVSVVATGPDGGTVDAVVDRLEPTVELAL